MWTPEGSEVVKFTLVRWLDMSYADLDAFQHGFNSCLKKRLDSPSATPVSEGDTSGNCTMLIQRGDGQLSEDPILREALEMIEITLEV